MNLATIRSTMPWMPTSVRRNLTPLTCTSKLASSFFVMDKPMAYPSRQAHHCLKTSIPKHTKLPALLDPQDHNGATRHPHLHHLGHQTGQSMVGEVDLLRSTHRPSQGIHMTSESLLEAQFQRLRCVDQARPRDQMK